MSDKLRAAAQAALSAMDYMLRNGEWYCAEERANALRAALAEQTVKESLTVAEPIGWLVTYGGLTHVEYTQPNMVVDTHYQPLYTASAEQKPMLEMNPEKREWVGLTGDEIEDINKDQTLWEIIRAAEAKLREKNA
jgi:hypothetical protein